ncbi:hypothetical protein FIBSPDRAFT_334508 [Athelia psychrophila]|uniref:Uncharacterized protein n=1 Tax=Athelia psychrophila TaxID=1759441 RepID=A0A166Q5W0_9AGAM|nr:hypothetical protein FIBSPDRAFT_334508 [Fibularhizoctonia sp. CBS 109695]
MHTYHHSDSPARPTQAANTPLHKVPLAKRERRVRTTRGGKRGLKDVHVQKDALKPRQTTPSSPFVVDGITMSQSSPCSQESMLVIEIGHTQPQEISDELVCLEEADEHYCAYSDVAQLWKRQMKSTGRMVAIKGFRMITTDGVKNINQKFEIVSVANICHSAQRLTIS